MSSSTKSDYLCQHGDTICEIRVYEQEVIVVPILLLTIFVVTMVFVFLLRYCPERVDRIRPENLKKSFRPQRNRRELSGIDAPPSFNPLEHESIALDLPNSTYSTFNPPHSYPSKAYASSKSLRVPVETVAPPQEVFRPSFVPVVQPRELPRQRLPEKFNLVSPLPSAFSLRSDSCIKLYRAQMENRNVVLRVLNDTADASERHSFLGFASFLAQLGPHPFLPELLGVVSLRAPLVTVIEELENRDLLSVLWRCRQETDPPCEMTERRIYTMASQVASALEFLHGKDLLHGNIRARSVLVSQSYTAKLWGLHGVYSRKNQSTQRDDPSMKKWQSPECLAKRPASHSSDIWSFGVLMFEMASLGEAPFAEIPVTELMQFHQRGKSLKKPFNCSNNLHSIIKSCCQWKESERPSLTDLSRKLSSVEKSASDKSMKSPGAVNIERYLQEAGYGETNNYTVF